MAPDDQTAGVVLAGGDSTRYGATNKLLEPVDGRPLVGHAVETLRTVTGSAPVVAVRTTAQREAVRDALAGAVRFRFDHPEYEGPLAGIAGALDAVSAPWTFVCAGDMPRVSADALATLAGARAADTDAVVPVRDVREPLHALYRTPALADALDALPADAGPRALCAELGCTDVRASAPLSRSLRNVNTPADLAGDAGGE